MWSKRLLTICFVAATAAEIEARYTDEDLERLIRAKGLESTTIPPAES